MSMLCLISLIYLSYTVFPALPHQIKSCKSETVMSELTDVNALSDFTDLPVLPGFSQLCPIKSTHAQVGR